MNRSFLFLIFLFMLPFAISGQSNDFGIWAGITAKHEFSKKLDAEIFLSVRTMDKNSAVDQYIAEAAINYKIGSYLSAGGSVRLINKLEDDEQYHFRRKMYLNIKGEVPAGNFVFSGRLTYQRTRMTYVEDVSDRRYENDIRFKVKAGYESGSSALRPFVSFEPFFPVFDETRKGIEKTRFSAGSELMITRKSSIEAAYIFENYTKEGKPGKNILSLGFQQVF